MIGILLEMFYPVAPEPSYGSGASEELNTYWRCLSGGIKEEASPDEPPVHTKCGLVEAPGVEPGSEDLQRNGSTCVADRFSFAATHAHRLA